MSKSAWVNDLQVTERHGFYMNKQNHNIGISKEKIRGSLQRTLHRIAFYALFFVVTVTTFLLSSNQSQAATKDFEIKDNVLIKYQGSSKNVTIPDTVKSIGDNAFQHNKKIQSVTIPNSVTTIGSSAFSDCTNLKEVKLSNKLTTIKTYAFYNCKNLMKITLPNSLNSIWDSAFYDSGLTSITIPNKIKKINQGVFSGCFNLISVTIPDSVTTIEDAAFSNCSSLKNITIPNSVTSLGDGAFYNCSSLVSIKLPDNITSLPSNIFWGCTSLVNITLPSKIAAIGNNAFTDCSKLEKIIIPDKVTKIEDYTFTRCESLTNVTLPKKLTHISMYAFYSCSKLKSIDIPDTVTFIGRCAFDDCTSLAKVTFPNSVKEIEPGAFSNTPWYKKIIKENPLFIVNNKLLDANSTSGVVTVPIGVTDISSNAFINSKATEVILPEGIIRIGDYAFASKYLKKINLPDTVTEIGIGAFHNASISSIKLPASLTSIKDFTFARCMRLKSLEIPEGVTSIGNQAFSDCISLAKISIPKSLVTIGERPFEENDALLNIQVDPENPVFTADGRFLFNQDKTVLLYCGSTVGEITIPEGVEKVSKDPFYYSTVTKVTFPSTLQYLEDNFFYMCSNLTEINLPSSLLEYGEQMHEYCIKLTSINVYEANDLINYTSEDGVLYDSDKSTLICAPGSGIITVKDGVTSIGSYAFPNWLDGIIIPKSVTSLADNIINYNMLWRPASDPQFYIYGYTGTEVEKYCKEKFLNFLAYDKTYKISYQLGGGTNHTTNPTSFTYDSTDLTFKNPTRVGYIFLYWYKDISMCEDGCCRGEEKITLIPQKSLGDIELIAKWEKVSVDKAVIKNAKKSSSTTISLEAQTIKDAVGYEIVYAKNSKFTSGKKTLTTKTASLKLSNLSKGSTYYIKVRAYKLDSTGKKVYGDYSKVKSVKL